MKFTIYSLIFVLMLTQCSTEVIENTSEKQDEPISYIEVEKILNYEISNEFLNQEIFIDDTINTSRINVFIDYEYTHRFIESILMEKIFHTLKENELLIGLKPKDDLFYVNIVYNFKGQNSALITVYHKSDLSFYKEYPYYEVFSNYIIDSMTPSDLQAYDYAFEVIYERNNDMRFKTNFQSFIKEMSSHLEPTENDVFILNELISWANEKDGIETPIHFEYFLNYVNNNVVFVDEE